MTIDPHFRRMMDDEAAARARHERDLPPVRPSAHMADLSDLTASDAQPYTREELNFVTPMLSDFASSTPGPNQRLRECLLRLLATAKQGVEAMQALEEYGEHHFSCSENRSYNPKLPCSCGFDAARAVSSSASKTTNQSPAAAVERGVRETPGLPPDESPERDAVCDALTRALLDAGETAGEAGERTSLDLESEEDMRGLMRLLTSRDGKGRDGPWGERTKQLWETVGRALSGAARSGLGDAQKASER